MSQKTAATVAHTIGIDTGKNTLHLIGLDDKGAIVLREKIARGRIRSMVRQCAAVSDRNRAEDTRLSRWRRWTGSSAPDNPHESELRMQSS